MLTATLVVAFVRPAVIAECVHRHGSGSDAFDSGDPLILDWLSGAGRCRRAGAVTLCVTALTLALAGPVEADLVVPTNGLANLNGGVVDLSCTDLIVGGTLQVGNGSVINARHVTIQAGGVIDGGSGAIELGGDWTDAGVFLAGTGSVRFRDLCSLTSASVGGSTSFFVASFVSTTGKNYVFAVGTTQTIANVLQISGTTPNPIQFRSATPGQVAFIRLQPAGTQLIQHVGVTDVWATGQWLAPYLSNEGGGGNANRWFGIPDDAALQIPTLGVLAQVLLALTLAGIAMFRLRRGTPRSTTHHTGRAARGRGGR